MDTDMHRVGERAGTANDGEKLLSCGHPPSPHGSFTTGYAETRDGKKICYDCANERERVEFAGASRFTAYLAQGGKHITTWTGGVLARVTSITKRWNNFARDYILHVRAEDITTGAKWYGDGPGYGMYIRMRISLRKAR